ncbi:trypsin-like peptidase domain-containing protein [Candidatus Falkowbacteria bacterium]|nr:MAG: trypsin-like peptidase domain-containing protein [Candidatus Falkowbacteria bacterium]
MEIIRTALAWSVIAITTVFVGFGVSQVISHQNVHADVLQFDEQEATIRAIKRAIPGVVSISIQQPSDNPADPKKVKKGSGSGFLISADGLILTNKHVVESGDEKSEYKVTLYSGKQYFAQLIGKDPLNDLAILKIYDKNLPYLEIGDSNKLTIGMTVIAIGNALGRYDNSATKGIVSGLARNLSIFGVESGDLRNLIQTDAEINLGNSGGPLINLEGKVVGVNVAKDNGGQSIGFSIPINEVKPIIESARTSERISRAYVGLRFYMITPELADEKKLLRTTGALIMPGLEEGEVAIIPGGPADKAGLQEGDIIFEIDGRVLDERLPISAIINQFKPGKKLGFKVQRGKSIFNKIVTLEEIK